jgi:chloride channel protein, CIC family
LNIVRVGEVMRKDVRPIAPEMTVGELAERMSRRESGFNMTEGLPIVGADGRLAGIVTQGDLLRALEKDPKGSGSVLDAGTKKPVLAYPDELAVDALHRILQSDVGRLPVVSREDPHCLVGYLNRASLLSAWTRQIDEEGLREHGWFRKWRQPKPEL